VVLVTEPQASCVKAAATAIDWMISCNLSVDILRVAVVNRAPLGVPVTIGAMSQTLGCEIIAAVAPAPDLAARAIQAARPIIVLSPDSLAAEALRRIADQVAA
jgi:MinD-like ATPase involved in chromosome partitioning or flagellar assembly